MKIGGDDACVKFLVCDHDRGVAAAPGRGGRFDEASGRVPGSRRTHRRRASTPSRPEFDAASSIFEVAKRVDFAYVLRSPASDTKRTIRVNQSTDAV